MKSLQNYTPGLLCCFLIALPAYILGKTFPLLGGPIFAILFGMILASRLSQSDKLKAGVSFTSKYVLQVAVVLLGFGLNLNQVAQVGIQSLPIILTTISTALLIAWLAYKYFRIDRQTAILVGVGSSICGGSAIAATAPVIEAEEAEVAKAISVIFLFNILAALTFPSLGQLLGLSNQGFATFAGTAVNDTSSVTATAAAWDAIHSSNTLEMATIIKLTRTLAIIPITLFLSVLDRRHKSQADNTFSLKRAFPNFLIYFILACLITTICDRLQWSLFLTLSSYFKHISKFFIIMAMAAVGLNTKPRELIQRGGPAIGLGGVTWLAISIVSLVMQGLLGSW